RAEPNQAPEPTPPAYGFRRGSPRAFGNKPRGNHVKREAICQDGCKAKWPLSQVAIAALGKRPRTVSRRKVPKWPSWLGVKLKDRLSSKPFARREARQCSSSVMCQTVAQWKPLWHKLLRDMA